MAKPCGAAGAAGPLQENWYQYCNLVGVYTCTVNSVSYVWLSPLMICMLDPRLGTPQTMKSLCV